jgi:hypothetical protein
VLVARPWDNSRCTCKQSAGLGSRSSACGRYLCVLGASNHPIWSSRLSLIPMRSLQLLTLKILSFRCTLKAREEPAVLWSGKASYGAREQQVPHPAFSPVRNDIPFFSSSR